MRSVELIISCMIFSKSVMSDSQSLGGDSGEGLLSQRENEKVRGHKSNILHLTTVPSTRGKDVFYCLILLFVDKASPYIW